MNVKSVIAAAVAVGVVACGAPAVPAPAPSAVTNTDASNIVVKDAWSRPTIAIPTDHGAVTDTQMGGMTVNDMGLALYMLIENKGSAPDTLIAVTSEVASSLTLHQTKDSNGMMMMEEMQDGIDVPAGSQVELKPAGLHVMMMDMKRALKAGDTYNVTLKFDSGKEILVVVAVRES